MLFICYKNCTTCKRAEKWLESHNLSFEKRDIKDENPTAAELKDWHKKSGLPLKRFFNTSGMVYREQKLKDKLPNMSDEEQYSLLATDGMLVKRPIIVKGDTVLVAFKEDEWEKALL